MLELVTNWMFNFIQCLYEIKQKKINIKTTVYKQILHYESLSCRYCFILLRSEAIATASNSAVLLRCDAIIWQCVGNDFQRFWNHFYAVRFRSNEFSLFQMFLNVLISRFVKVLLNKKWKLVHRKESHVLSIFTSSPVNVEICLSSWPSSDKLGIFPS